MMQRFIFFTMVMLFSNSFQAQDFQFDLNCILFQDTKTGLPILIEHDSLLYKGNPLLKTAFKYSSYPDRLANYNQYSIKGKTFFVHMGSGPILEFRNDSIVACNNTPNFQNQYGSAKFVYKNELHLFGGYGLFAYKNMVTKYDAKNQDWIQVQTFGEDIPEPRARFYSYLLNENLYVFGGDQEDPKNFPNFKKCDNIIWRLNLPTMKWYKMGRMDSTLLSNNSYSSFFANGTLYLISNSNYSDILEIDIEKNTLKIFKGESRINPVQIYYDSSKKEVVYLTEVSRDRFKLTHVDLKTFLGQQIDQREFIIPFYKERVTAAFGFGIGLLVIMLISFIYRKKSVNKSRPILFRGIVYNKATAQCYYKNKLISNFDETELRVLLFLIEHSDRYISISELNYLFENENDIENYSSVVKKRQVSSAALLKKLNAITSVSENEILLNRKNPEDKRIKEIKIASSFLKIK
jgi:hypothetical protein